MADWEGPLHRCPVCGSGACWTAPLQPDNGHESRVVLFCGDCGATMGEEHDWHDLGAADATGPTPLRRWLRLYRHTRRPRVTRAAPGNVRHAARAQQLTEQTGQPDRQRSGGPCAASDPAQGSD